MTDVVKLSKDLMLKNILEKLLENVNVNYYFSKGVIAELSKLSNFNKTAKYTVYIDILADDTHANFEFRISKLGINVPFGFTHYRLALLTSDIVSLNNRMDIFADTVYFLMDNETELYEELIR